MAYPRFCPYPHARRSTRPGHLPSTAGYCYVLGKLIISSALFPLWPTFQKNHFQHDYTFLVGAGQIDREYRWWLWCWWQWWQWQRSSVYWENCDADGENCSDEYHTNFRQCLTDVDFTDSEKDSVNEQDMNEAKNVSGGQGNVMDKETDLSNEAQGNEREELFSASEEDWLLKFW